MTPKTKEKLVLLNVWIPKSLKEAAIEVSREHGDISRMVKDGLRKEIVAKRQENEQFEKKAS